MVTVKTIVVNPWQLNCYVLFDETREAVIIDAGCLSDADEKALIKVIDENQLKPVLYLNTHCHLDHVFGNYFILEKYGLKTHAHKADEFLLNQAPAMASGYGFAMKNNPPALENYIQHGDVFKFGNSELETFHIPGHCPGGVVFFNRANRFVIVGDVIFRESIGRTDLPGGNHHELMDGIDQYLMSMDDDVVAYPGHGPATTIGHERTHNPFLQ